jgi:hypothetical protein
MKGKPWTVEEEKQLREMVQAKKSLVAMAEFFGKTPESVKQKIRRLGLKVVVRQIAHTTTSVEELPSVEEALRTLNKALKSLETPGLDQAETLRLRSIIQGVKIYIERFADFLDYRELETRLIELEGKYAALVKKTTNSRPERV